MRKALVAVCTLVLVAAVPSSALAWGFVAHRYIMRRAIDVLPPALKPFFNRFHEEVVVRATDPEWMRIGPRNDAQIRKARKAGCDVVSQAIGEGFGIAVGCTRLKRQNRNPKSAFSRRASYLGRRLKLR